MARWILGWAAGGVAALACWLGCGGSSGSVPPDTTTVMQPAPDAGGAAVGEDTGLGAQQPDSGVPAQDDAGLSGDQGDSGPEAATGQDAGTTDGGAEAALVADSGPGVDAAGMTFEWVDGCESPTTGSIWGEILTTSHTVSSVDITVRYWLAHALVQYVTPVNGQTTATLRQMSDVGMPTTTHAVQFIEIAFQGLGFNPGRPGFFYLGTRIDLAWGGRGGTADDWSDDLRTQADGGCTNPWNHVTLYYRGVLVWGIEPTPTTDP
jgi:hypothetical protein